MVAGGRSEGGAQILSAGVRKTIQSIKEIVGNHSDADIYVVLKETDMNADETAQKLLNQDPFHEVRRKRDKRKEVLPQNIGYKGVMESRKSSEQAAPEKKFSTSSRGAQRVGYTRNGTTVAGGNREFRIVRDNRVNQSISREMRPPLLPCSTLSTEQLISHVSVKGSTGISDNPNSSGSEVMQTVSNPRHSQDTNSSSTTRKELQEKEPVVPSAVTQLQGSNPHSQPQFATLASNHSVIGLYSSSSDPVHVPSPDTRSAANIGAIKRELGAVGVRRQSSETSGKPLPAQNSSLSKSHLGKDASSSRESVRASTRNDQPYQTTLTESVVPSTSISRSFLSNQYNSRPHQQIVGHQKASQPNKEWKPKLSQKSSANGPGVIGTPAKSVLDCPTESSQDLEFDAMQVQDKDKPSRVNNFENQNVIIAEHIRVNESDRCRLTFGSFGSVFDSSNNVVLETQTDGSAENSSAGPSTSLSVSTTDSSGEETSVNKHVALSDDQLQNSGSDSPASGAVSENQLPEKKESSSLQNLDRYAKMGLVHDNGSSYSALVSQEQQDAPELPSFSAYDPQNGYDIPYFRPTMDETVRGQSLPSPQEALSSQTTNSTPASTIAMVQQQQPQVAQMYPPVHVSPFGNLMPYRQYISPVYVPPMPMPSYSSNAAYPHPSNGSSYLLMPGGGSHLNANSLKYGIQQFKPVPAGSPTGFGNFTSATGYAVNAQGVVGSAAGLEDGSRLKYKDNNIYVPNPQAETSEIWIQNPRELPGMQSASYYNLPGQTPHATYLPSHSGHGSFNAAAAAAVAQSSHMQFPAMYHSPPQQAAMANPHHLGPAIGGNVGVGVGVAAASPGTQVGAYQQPQLGHLNWTTNF
ncbi:GBF-interacting protein 1-like isoform X3 [Diospyros lotus]|uniref:GBF-interacting protein 1-like isoform X3 n=1 Tax=Diospyros lotus TaxID=55363 RepID=UPI00224C9BF8|nr:GBF-interacting protein 1-like isoform X3 [Diospyros lotus]